MFESRRNLTLVIVAALGYFVDVYDLILFGIVRSPSLISLGLSGQEVTNEGITLFNYQMAGMLLGGILWGVLGDKRGRLSVLFGSILIYSLANILNGMVQNVQTYALLRFVAGIGLAGELGAGITLVNEAMSKENRGIGTTIIVSFGPMGAVTASLIGSQFDWRMAYYVGGAMGLLLLLLRIGTFESAMFQKASATEVKKGDFLSLFTNKTRLLKYLKCVLIGNPIWYVISILILFSPEISAALGVTSAIKAPVAIMWGYIGLSAGDFANGFLSQYLKSRRKPLLYFMLISLVCNVAFLHLYGVSNTIIYFSCFLLGTFAGTWAIFVTTASEQFGTNIRATVTTTVPNFVRGAVILITLAFKHLTEPLGVLHAALVVGLVCSALGIWAVLTLEETFGKDLDYVE